MRRPIDTLVDDNFILVGDAGCQVGLTTDACGLGKISELLAELGLDLKVMKKGRPGVKMSKKLKESIWWIVKNREKPWNKEQEDDPWNE